MSTLRPIGTAKAEAINHYATRAFEFEELNRAAGGEVPAIILDGLHYVEMNPVAILDNAGKAEMNDPEPQCGAMISDHGNLTHCVAVWRHKGEHVPLE